MTLSLILLLVLYQIKHFVCDYPLQNQFMLGKFLSYPKFVLPLLAHSGVHAVFTFLISLLFSFDLKLSLSLAIFDMVVHFIVDRIKASPDLLGRFKPLTKDTYIEAVKNNDLNALKGNTYFWWALGADQMAHHLTHYVIIGVIVGK